MDPQPAQLPQAEVRASGGAVIRIVDPQTAEADIGRRRQGVVQRPAGPAAQGRRVLGARIISQETAHPTAARVRPSAPTGNYGASVVGAQPQPYQGQSPGAFNAALSAQMDTARSQLIASPSVTQNVTVIMGQHGRPETLGRQYQALVASGLSDRNMICWVNPAGIRLDDGLLGRIPHVRASTDMGPRFRWILTMQSPTKYTLVIDDDCVPGNAWLSAAIQRLELAEQKNEEICIAAAGSIYQSDRFDSIDPIGPESLKREEVEVDVGRGAWLMRTEHARLVPVFPCLGSPLEMPLRVAAALQHDRIRTIVLPYPHNERDKWGMLDQPTARGSMSSVFDREAQQGRGPTAAMMRRADYEVYRQAAGWTPLCVSTEKDHAHPDRSGE